MDEVVAMSRRELDRAQIVGKGVEGRLTQANAGLTLKLSVRKVKRVRYGVGVGSGVRL